MKEKNTPTMQGVHLLPPGPPPTLSLRTASPFLFTKAAPPPVQGERAPPVGNVRVRCQWRAPSSAPPPPPYNTDSRKQGTRWSSTRKPNGSSPLATGVAPPGAATPATSGGPAETAVTAAAVSTALCSAVAPGSRGGSAIATGSSQPGGGAGSSHTSEAAGHSACTTSQGRRRGLYTSWIVAKEA